MTTAIRIENLGKCYSIGSGARREGYVTLRDVLSEGIKTFSNNLMHPQNFFKQGAETRDFWALRDINMEIEHGDKIAIIGHNGAGKSTLLKILSQITEPTEGKIEIFGRVSSLLEVGTGFHPELTGRENIYLNGAILGMSHAEIRRKFDEIVDFAGVELFLDTPVKRYSSGMRMRLGFAVAAHLDSEILVIDEVLAVGDAAFQKKCIGKMDSISRSEGRTILFVSHNINAVAQLCNRGAVLDKGKLLFTGSVADATQKYEDLLSEGKTSFNVVVRNEALNLLNYTLVEGVATEQDWSFSFSFRSNERFEDCFFDFGIYSEKYYPIIHHMAQPISHYFDIKKGVFTINVTLPSVPLNVGSYQLIIYLANKDGSVLYEAKGIPVAFVTEAHPQNGATSILVSQPVVTIQQEEE